MQIPEAPIGVNFRPGQDDVLGVLIFGVALCEAGQPEDAAGVFLDAARQFVSKDCYLELDLIKAAVRCHWLAGNLDGMKQDFVILDRLYEEVPYARYMEGTDIRQIRDIVFSGSKKDKAIASR